MNILNRFKILNQNNLKEGRKKYLEDNFKLTTFLIFKSPLACTLATSLNIRTSTVFRTYQHVDIFDSSQAYRFTGHSNRTFPSGQLNAGLDQYINK